jgi:hypothetical protein
MLLAQADMLSACMTDPCVDMDLHGRTVRQHA